MIFKSILSKNHNIKILYYANYKYNFPYDVIQDKYALLQKITQA